MRERYERKYQEIWWLEDKAGKEIEKKEERKGDEK